MVTHPGTPEHARWLAYTDPRLRPGRAGLRQPQPDESRSTACGRTRFLLLAALSSSSPSRWRSRTCQPLAEAFHATPLEPDDWAIVAVVALAPAILAEVLRTVRGRTWIA